MIDRPQSDPVKVPLAPKPLGLWGTAMIVRRNVLEVIPIAATREPIISSTSGLRWHMVMEPAALRHILKERVEDYPKSVNTKLIPEHTRAHATITPPPPPKRRGRLLKNGGAHHLHG